MRDIIYFIILYFAILVGCIDHSISKNDFMIQWILVIKNVPVKDYIQCWVNDSLVLMDCI